MDNVEKLDVMDALTLFKSELEEDKILPTLIVTSDSDTTVTATNGTRTLTPTQVDNQFTFKLPSLGNWTVDAYRNGNRFFHDSIDINAVTTFFADTSHLRYGIRISKDENAAVEYLYDAEGMTPAHMDFENGTFDYGDWQDAWFIKDNKPCMLSQNGTVAYYLDPNDYSKKEDGTPSDIEDTTTSLNAMAQIPLVWIHRYEDSNYYYEIFANYQHDENYKAYAHTDNYGFVKPYFYRSIYLGSLFDGKLRSLSGKSHLTSVNAATMLNYAVANGDGWNCQSWSQFSLIHSLLRLIACSVDFEGKFGNRPLSYSGGQGNTLGQFFGTTGETAATVHKLFHIESMWISLNVITGFLQTSNAFFVKMTPPYSMSSTSGYTNVGAAVSCANNTDGYFLKTVRCNEYGLIPATVDTTSTTYFRTYYKIISGSIMVMYSQAAAGHYLIVNTTATVVLACSLDFV